MNPFRLTDLKTILPGVALAVAAGLSLGGMMKPNLLEGDGRPAGPQMMADWAGVRSTGPFDPGTSFIAYRDHMPDYVLGTDWKKATAWPAERVAASEPREVVADTPAPANEHPVYAHAVYDEPAPVPHVYPSVVGGAPPGAPSASDVGVAVDDDTLPAEA